MALVIVVPTKVLLMGQMGSSKLALFSHLAVMWKKGATHE